MEKTKKQANILARKQKCSDLENQKYGSICDNIETFGDR
jgi:hypothetical protein